MKSWDEIRDWRRAKRAELRSRRVSLPRDEKDRVRATVTNLIRQQVPEFGSACIGSAGHTRERSTFVTSSAAPSRMEPKLPCRLSSNGPSRSSSGRGGRT